LHRCSPEMETGGRKALPQSSLGVSRSREESVHNAPLYEVTVGVLLEHLRHAVTHLDANALDELVVGFITEGRDGHLGPRHCNRGLAAEENRRHTRRAVTARF